MQHWISQPVKTRNRTDVCGNVALCLSESIVQLYVSCCQQVWNSDKCLPIACVCVRNFLSGSVTAIFMRVTAILPNTSQNASTNVVFRCGYMVLPMTLPIRITIFTPLKCNSSRQSFGGRRPMGNPRGRWEDALWMDVAQICSRYGTRRRQQVTEKDGGRRSGRPRP